MSRIETAFEINQTAFTITRKEEKGEKMKERIVIDFKDVKCAEDKNYVIAKKEKCKVEKYPTSWEELKELIKQKVKEDNHNGIKKGFGSIEYILIDDKSFLPTGEILDEDNDVFAVNRTPQQMWQIIKSLIGEE